MISTFSSRLATNALLTVSVFINKASNFTTNPQSRKVPKKPFNTYKAKYQAGMEPYKDQLAQIPLIDFGSSGSISQSDRDDANG